MCVCDGGGLVNAPGREEQGKAFPDTKPFLQEPGDVLPTRSLMG